MIICHSFNKKIFETDDLKNDYIKNIMMQTKYDDINGTYT